jgi:hypothetical protein
VRRPVKSKPMTPVGKGRAGDGGGRVRDCGGTGTGSWCEVESGELETLAGRGAVRVIRYMKPKPKPKPMGSKGSMK